MTTRSSHAARLLRAAVAALEPTLLPWPLAYDAEACLHLADRLATLPSARRLPAYDHRSVADLDALERALWHAGERGMAADVNDLSAAVRVLLPLIPVVMPRAGKHIVLRCLDFAVGRQWPLASCDVGAHTDRRLVHYTPLGSAPWPDTRAMAIQARVCPALAAHLSDLHLTNQVRPAFVAAWQVWRTRTHRMVG